MHCIDLSGKLPLSKLWRSPGGRVHVAMLMFSITVSPLVSEAVDDLGACGCCGSNGCDGCFALQDLRATRLREHE